MKNVVCEGITKRTCLIKDCFHAKIHEPKYLSHSEKTCNFVDCYHTSNSKGVKCVFVLGSNIESELNRILDI